jgi:hypothetical protein
MSSSQNDILITSSGEGLTNGQRQESVPGNPARYFNTHCFSDFTWRWHVAFLLRLSQYSLAWEFMIGCLGQTCRVATLERKTILFRRGQRRRRIKGQGCRIFPIPTTFGSATRCPDRKPLCLFLKEQSDATNKLNSSPFFHSKSYKVINNQVTNCKTIFDSLPVLG